MVNEQGTLFGLSLYMSVGLGADARICLFIDSVIKDIGFSGSILAIGDGLES
jgi:hypothetical protein